jgi:Lrp/AsnC family leucine-responsive transcriptional regulator
MHSPRPLDDIDIAILDVLQDQGRTRRNALAELTGLSVPAISDRLKKLEESGVIRGYRALLDPKKLGWDVNAYINVTVDSSRHYAAFLKHANTVDEILECHAVTGDGTHLLKVRTANTEALEKLLSTIQSWSGVQRTATQVILSSPKETARIPVSAARRI